jgi:hypothetical protein
VEHQRAAVVERQFAGVTYVSARPSSLVGRTTPSDGALHGAGRKALAHERGEQPARHRGIARILSAPQPLLERLFEQRLLVELLEHLSERVAGHVVVDPKRAELTLDAGASLMLHLHARSSRGECDAPIVERTRCLQPRDCAVHRVCLESAPGEALPNLKRRDLASRQHREASRVRFGD